MNTKHILLIKANDVSRMQVGSVIEESVFEWVVPLFMVEETCLQGK